MNVKAFFKLKIMKIIKNVCFLILFIAIPICAVILNHYFYLTIDEVFIIIFPLIILEAIIIYFFIVNNI